MLYSHIAIGQNYYPSMRREDCQITSLRMRHFYIELRLRHFYIELRMRHCYIESSSITLSLSYASYLQLLSV